MICPPYERQRASLCGLGGGRQMRHRALAVAAARDKHRRLAIQQVRIAALIPADTNKAPSRRLWVRESIQILFSSLLPELRERLAGRLVHIPIKLLALLRAIALGAAP